MLWRLFRCRLLSQINVNVNPKAKHVDYEMKEKQRLTPLGYETGPCPEAAPFLASPESRTSWVEKFSTGDYPAGKEGICKQSDHVRATSQREDKQSCFFFFKYNPFKCTMPIKLSIHNNCLFLHSGSEGSNGAHPSWPSVTSRKGKATQVVRSSQSHRQKNHSLSHKPANKFTVSNSTQASVNHKKTKSLAFKNCTSNYLRLQFNSRLGCTDFHGNRSCSLAFDKHVIRINIVHKEVKWLQKQQCSLSTSCTCFNHVQTSTVGTVTAWSTNTQPFASLTTCYK